MSSAEEQIKSVIEAVASNWDLHNWNEAKKLFADVVEIDYTSLGAPSVTHDPIDQLAQNWQMVLPMFDRTKHFVDTFEITLVSPKEARSRCHVLAYHYLKGGEKGENWILIGHYEHNLVQ